MWDFLGGIGGLFDGIGSVLADLWGVLSYLFALIWDVFAYLFNLVVAVLRFLYGILGSVGKLFQKLWDGFFKGILTRLANAIIRVHQWLEDHLGPVIRFLQKVRAYIDRLFNIYVRPILNAIQHVRRVLAVLRALHIKFAEELDRKLLEVEGKITRAFLTVRGVLNAAISTLNAAVDPARLVRLVAVGVMGRRTVAAIVRIYTGLPLGFFLPNYRADAEPWEKPVLGVDDLRDPARNPLPSVLFPAVDPLPVTDFMAADPTPTAANLDADNVLPFYADLVTAYMSMPTDADDDAGPFARAREALQYGTGPFAIIGEGLAATLSDRTSGGGGW